MVGAVQVVRRHQQLRLVEALSPRGQRGDDEPDAMQIARKGTAVRGPLPRDERL
jgi:hypothetical protein